LKDFVTIRIAPPPLVSEIMAPFLSFAERGGAVNSGAHEEISSFVAPSSGGNVSFIEFFHPKAALRTVNSTA
jgi:hypothetical protein